jgi:hypothetical protein
VGFGLDDARAGDKEELSAAYRDIADIEGMRLRAGHRLISSHLAIADVEATCHKGC